MKLDSTLTKLCKDRGWSLAKLARESGVSPQTIHNWTLRRKAVNVDQLRKVATALNVSLHFLIFGEPDPFEEPGQEILKELFSGDVRVTLHRIERGKGRPQT